MWVGFLTTGMRDHRLSALFLLITHLLIMAATAYTDYASRSGSQVHPSVDVRISELIWIPGDASFLTPTARRSLQPR